MKVLVTGAAGRLGSDLVVELTRRKYTVKAFDIPTADFSRLPKKNHVEIVRGDITRVGDTKAAIKDMDGVFHLAAVLPPKSEINREVTLQVNLDGTKNLLEATKTDGREIPIVFTSSVMVYGVTANETPPITEDHALVTTDVYSESKIACEELIRKSGMPYAILRISGIYAVELTELPEKIPFRKEQRVNFVDRRDVIQALISAFETNERREIIFNIAGDGTWRMKGDEFTKRMYEAFGIPVEIQYSKTYTCFDWYDTLRSQSTLNYQKIDFERFIEDLEELARKLF
jgi:nucleoside-diphosphate-sugar epimerase